MTLPTAGPPIRVDRRRNSAQILEAAAVVLAANPGASMQAIADAAGLTRLTVYRHYAGRDALEMALLAAIDDQAAVVIAAAPPWEPDLATLRALVAGLADLIQRFPVILTWHRVETGQRRAAVDARLSDLLRQGQVAGLLSAEVSPDVLNATLFAMLSVHAGLYPERDSREWAKDVTNLLVRGLTTAASASDT